MVPSHNSADVSLMLREANGTAYSLDFGRPLQGPPGGLQPMQLVIVFGVLDQGKRPAHPRAALTKSAEQPAIRTAPCCCSTVSPHCLVLNVLHRQNACWRMLRHLTFPAAAFCAEGHALVYVPTSRTLRVRRPPERNCRVLRSDGDRGGEQHRGVVQPGAARLVRQRRAAKQDASTLRHDQLVQPDRRVHSSGAASLPRLLYAVLI